MQAYIGDIIPEVKAWWGENALGIFFGGCNFKCPSCFSADILEFKSEFIKDDKEIKKAIRDLNPSAILISGGEPLLQRDALFSILRFAKLKKIRVGIETNGSKPEVLSAILENSLVDFVSLDFKAPLNDLLFERVTRSKTFFKLSSDLIRDFKMSLNLLIKNQDKVEVSIKTLIVPGLMYRKEDLLAIAINLESFSGKWHLHPILSDHNLLSKRYEDIIPPSDQFLITLKEAINKSFPNLDIVLLTEE